MRWNVALLVLALVGVVAGAALIGRWCVGVAVIADSVVVGVLALLRDVPERPVASGARERWRSAA